MKAVVSIIILSFNHLDYTRLCIQSIFAHTSMIKTPYDIIVVDNGSTDGTREYLAGLAQAKEIQLILNEKNNGFPKANNQGIAIAEGEYVCLLNNDTIVTELWLENMLRIIRSDPKIAAVGPYCNYSSGYQAVKNAPKYQDDKQLQELAKTFAGEVKKVDFLVFFCALIRKSVFIELGGLDEDLGKGNYEDNLFCYKAIEKGYILKVVNHYIYHWGSVTFTGENKDPKKYREYLAHLGRNQKIFHKKIGKYKTIALCMIVSDRENPETLKRCLDSVVDYVDHVCIVFNYKRFQNYRRYTKLVNMTQHIVSGHSSMSSAGTPIKFRETYLKWTNFSEMRNRSLSMMWDYCPLKGNEESLTVKDGKPQRLTNNQISMGDPIADYILWLDADDVMMTPQGPRDLILRYPDIDYFKTKLYCPNERGETSLIYKTHLFKNKYEYRFRKYVHEDITLSLLENKATYLTTNITVHHLGYDSIKTVLRKNKRNIKLIQREIDEGIADQLSYYHLIQAWCVLNTVKDKKFRIEKYKEIIKTIDFVLDKFKLTDKDPLTPTLWYFRGTACLDAGQVMAGKQSLHKAFDQWNDPESGVTLAQVYYDEKNYDKAIQILEAMYDKGTFEKGMNMPFDQKLVENRMYQILGDSYLNKNVPERAEHYYRECIEVNPNNLEVADRLCQILRNTKRLREANILTVTLVNKFPTYYVGWNNLGQAELLSRRYHTAKLFFEHTLDINSKFEPARINLNSINKILKKGAKT